MSREPFNPYLIQPPEGPWAPAVGSGPMTVSQLSALVKQAIETALPATVHVVGQISNFKRHSSGHLYFTLKDAVSELSCVMWRSEAARMKFMPADGLEVIATGAVEVFERAGRYQLYVRRLEPRGIGALELAFRQLREKLEKEGLFEAARKRPLPRFPRRVALVTSPTGAAIADMLRTIQRRYACVCVSVYPVRVQGAGAATEIAGAIARINAHAARLGGFDVLIVGRGGGSLEDLWAFNEEIVARAIHASLIPVVSGVGHESDVTIADLVADVRAATPTAAAELVVPVLAELLEGLDAIDARYGRVMRAGITLAAARVCALTQRRAFSDPKQLIHRRGQVLDLLCSRVAGVLQGQIRGRRRQLDVIEDTVRRIAPHHYLLRLARQLGLGVQRLDRAMGRLLGATVQSMHAHSASIERASPAPRLRLEMSRTDAVSRTLDRAMRHRLTLCGERIEAQQQRLRAVGYESVLARGFSVTRRKKGRRVLRSVGDLRDCDRVVTQLADGEFESEVVNRTQLELFG